MFCQTLYLSAYAESIWPVPPAGHPPKLPVLVRLNKIFGGYAHIRFTN